MKSEITFQDILQAKTRVSIKPEVIDLVREINHLSERDLQLAKDMVRRLRIPTKE